MFNQTLFTLITAVLICTVSSFQISNKFSNWFEKKIQPLYQTKPNIKCLNKVKLSSILTSFCVVYSLNTMPILAADQGANDVSNSKIKKGGASTLQQGQYMYSCFTDNLLFTS